MEFGKILSIFYNISLEFLLERPYNAQKCFRGPVFRPFLARNARSHSLSPAPPFGNAIASAHCEEGSIARARDT